LLVVRRNLDLIGEPQVVVLAIEQAAGERAVFH
jgi:hypothetical protein